MIAPAITRRSDTLRRRSGGNVRRQAEGPWPPVGETATCGRTRAGHRRRQSQSAWADPAEALGGDQAARRGAFLPALIQHHPGRFLVGGAAAHVDPGRPSQTMTSGITWRSDPLRMVGRQRAASGGGLVPPVAEAVTCGRTRAGHRRRQSQSAWADRAEALGGDQAARRGAFLPRADPASPWTTPRRWRRCSRPTSTQARRLR